MNLYEGKLEPLRNCGPCMVLVQFVEDLLQKATANIPACDRVKRVNDYADLKPLNAAIDVIVLLAHRHYNGSVTIGSVVGVEAVVKVMKTFPKCLTLQETACSALRNLTYCNLGQKKALEAGQTIDLLLAALKNHLASPYLCVQAVLALYNVIMNDDKSTELLPSSEGVAAAVNKVRDQWPEVDSVQQAVKLLASALPQQNTVRSEPSNKRKPKAQEPETVVGTGSDDHQSDRAARRTMHMLAFVAHQQSSEPSNDRKRKPMVQERKAVVTIGSDDRQNDRKARRVSTDDALAFTIEAHQTTEEEMDVQSNNLMESILKLSPDIFHSNSTKASAALRALFRDLVDDKLDKLQATGGCLAFVKHVKDCLRKATERIPRCDRVNEVNEFTEVEALNAAFDDIVVLTTIKQGWNQLDGWC